MNKEIKKQYIIKNNKLYHSVASCNGLIHEWEELDVPVANNLKCIWNGQKIPFCLWRVCIAFLAKSQELHDSEALIYLFYHEKTNTWKAWAPPQKVIGMKVESSPNIKKYKDQRNSIGPGYIPIGTIHHHCNGAAGQSGIDKADEANKEGIHITLGYMEQKLYDWHARVIFNEEYNGINPDDWIELPEWSQKIPEQYRHFLKKDIFLSKYTEEELKSVPDIWFSNIVKTTYKPFPKKKAPHMGFFPDGGFFESKEWKNQRNTNNKHTLGKKNVKDAQKRLAKQDKQNKKIARAERLIDLVESLCVRFGVSLWDFVEVVAVEQKSMEKVFGGEAMAKITLYQEIMKEMNKLGYSEQEVKYTVTNLAEDMNSAIKTEREEERESVLSSQGIMNYY